MRKLKLILYTENYIKYGINKTDIYNKYLNKDYFEIYLIFSNNKTSEIINEKENIYLVPEYKLKYFIIQNKIDIFCSFSSNTNLLQELKKVVLCFNSVNFTPLYIKDSEITNLIISKTDYLKIAEMNGGKLKNAYVVYNPLDVKLWIDNSKRKENYLDYFKDKKIKFIVGRLGRAEPTKWNFLIISTLIKLDIKKNYNYGFIFAGMPKLYFWTLKLLLSKKAKENILILKQHSGAEEVSKFYNSIDVFWQTSYIGESFGNVIAESFCFNIPVITDFKDFYKKNRIVNPKLYNAQMELVDFDKNGFYANYPFKFIEILENLDKKKIKIYGKNGNSKARSHYDIKVSCKTMEKIFFEKTYERKIVDSIPMYYQNFTYYPTLTEVKNFKKVYLNKLSTAKKRNQITLLDKIWYKLFEKIWNIIEFFYVIVRYILKKYLKINLER